MTGSEFVVLSRQLRDALTPANAFGNEAEVLAGVASVYASRVDDAARDELLDGGLRASKRLERLVEALLMAARLDAEDVTFRSPVVFKPYEGRDAVAMILGAVVQVFEDFRYTDQVETDETATLAFSARVGDRELDGIDLLRFDSDGRVRELAVAGDDVSRSRSKAR